MIEMKISGLAVDPNTHMPIVLLKDDTGEKILPIWIGPFEASAIILEMEGIEPPRPLTHDLFMHFLNDNNISVEKVIINEIIDNTYYAKIYYKNKRARKKRELDSRPSDAIAMAVRAKAPIFVTTQVLIHSLGLNSVPKEDAKDFYKEYLDKLDLKDFNSGMQ